MREIDAIIEKLTQEYNVPVELLTKLIAAEGLDPLKTLKGFRDYIYTIKPAKNAKTPTKFFFSGTLHQIQPSSRLTLSNNNKKQLPPRSISGVFESPDGIFRPDVIAGKGFKLIVNTFFPVSEEQAKAFVGDGN